MIREHIRFLQRAMVGVDIVTITISFFVAYALRDASHGLYPLRFYIRLLPIICIIWISLLYMMGIYEAFRSWQKMAIYTIIFKAAIMGMIIFTSGAYLMKMPELSRVFVTMNFALASLLIALEKTLLLIFFRDLRRKGYNYRNLLIVGSGSRAQKFLALLHQHPEYGFRVTGLIDEDESRTGQRVNGFTVLGTFKDVPRIVHTNVIDEVVFVVPRSWLSKIEEVMNFCESEGLRIHLAVDYFALKLSRAKTSDFYDWPLLTFEITPARVGHLVLKRILDVIIATVALVILAPVFGIAALLVKATSPGPVFFKQTRCGINGRRFVLFKFRSMVVDAEARIKDLVKRNEMNGPVFKIANDPRITKVGKYLRKFSIDELPQLYNVLRGDMSIVGPRPPLPSEVEKYDPWHRRRLSMRPGITCLWQVSGRNTITDFNRWAQLDLEYIDNWSLWLDVKLFFKTIPAVLFSVGAK